MLTSSCSQSLHSLPAPSGPTGLCLVASEKDPDMPTYMRPLQASANGFSIPQPYATPLRLTPQQTKGIRCSVTALSLRHCASNAACGRKVRYGTSAAREEIPQAGRFQGWHRPHHNRQEVVRADSQAGMSVAARKPAEGHGDLEAVEKSPAAASDPHG